MQPGKLNANVVLVKLNGKDLYLDPGAEYTPFRLFTPVLKPEYPA